MRIVETRAFTARVVRLLDDLEYRLLQLALMRSPESGAVIPGSGGIRKIRWSRSGMGKRGGLRILYFWHEASGTLLMLFVFAKREAGDLTRAQLRILRRVVEEEYP